MGKPNSPRGSGRAKPGARSAASGAKGAAKGGAKRYGKKLPAARARSGEPRTANQTRTPRGPASGGTGQRPRPGTKQSPRMDPSLPLLPRPLDRELTDTAARGRADEAKAAMQKALAAFDREELGKAAGEARRAKDAAPRSPSVREALGLIYHARGEHKDALAELQAFRRMAGSPLQDAVIADCLLKLGRPEKALETLGDLQRTDVDDRAWAEAQVIRAKAHEDRGNVVAAVGVLRAADADPHLSEGNHLRVRYALADVLDRNGEREEARMLFARIAVKAPAFLDALERAR